MKIAIPLAVGLVMVSLLILVSSSLPIVLVFIPGVIITLVFHFSSTYNRKLNPNHILPLYLLALGIQFLHFTEEYVTGFNVEVARLLGQSAYAIEDWLIFNMVAYCIFIWGGIVLYKMITSLMVIPLFFIIVGVILNSLAHLATSIYLGAYFPGLYTAFLYLFLAPILIREIIKEMRVAEVQA